MVAKFEQGGLDTHLVIEREGDGWYFTMQRDGEGLWGGNLQSLVEHILLAVVAKQQLVEDIETQKNGNPTVLLQALSKKNPAKAREFLNLLAGQVDATG